jgi:cytochrome c553
MALLSVAATAAPVSDWAWLFPLAEPAPVNKPDDDATALHVPGSRQSFTAAQTDNLNRAVDWFPAEHPTMPAIVATGHADAYACGYCHLPTGAGRPENSALAGLPADYIKREVRAFADGSRQAALASALPAKLMAATAKAAPPADVDRAAAYFSRLRYVSHVRVIETAEAAFRPARFIYGPDAGPRQPLGNRIIEMPIDPERFELRDPHTRFVAYVPPGALAAGKRLAASGGPAGLPCATCHGDGLRGGIAPPLAGRSPTTLMRQLAAFKSGARANVEAAPMRAITASLDDRQMIALAAYAATLKP